MTYDEKLQKLGLLVLLSKIYPETINPTKAGYLNIIREKDILISDLKEETLQLAREHESIRCN